MRKDSMQNNEVIVRALVDEVVDGRHHRDYLPNDAFDFSKEAQALYFSRARSSLGSEMAFSTMNHAQDLRELKLFDLLGLGGAE